MPVKRRINKRREALCEDAERWLRGEPCGFFEFKDADELAALWAEYGDPEVAEWDDEAKMPRASKPRLFGKYDRQVLCYRMAALPGGKNASARVHHTARRRGGVAAFGERAAIRSDAAHRRAPSWGG
jgi:hypothetical protein